MTTVAERRGAGRLTAAAGRALARLGGAVLAGGFALGGVLRRGKPIHSLGAVTGATWWVMHPARLGVPLLDRPGPRRVLVRLSRSVSWSRTGRDIMGLAVRVPRGAADGSDADLLFATAGSGRWTRWLLATQPRWGVGLYTTLMPVRSRGGAVVMLLRARSVTDYRLAALVRRRGRRWIERPVGRLTLDRPPEADRPLRFHPVEAPPAGFGVPGWARALRRPAYRAARRAART